MTNKRNTKTKRLAAGSEYSSLEPRRFLSANTILIESPEALASNCEPEIVSHKDMTTVMEEQPFAGSIDSFFELGAPSAINAYLPVGDFGFASLYPAEILIVDTFFETSANDFWQFDRNEMSFNVESFRQFEDVIFETVPTSATFARPAAQAFEASFAPTQSPTVTSSRFDSPTQLTTQPLAQSLTTSAPGGQADDSEIQNTRLRSLQSVTITIARPSEGAPASNPAVGGAAISPAADDSKNNWNSERGDANSFSPSLNGADNSVFLENLNGQKTLDLTNEFASNALDTMTSTALKLGRGQPVSATAAFVATVDFGGMYTGGNLPAMLPSDLMAFTSLSTITPLDGAIELDGLFMNHETEANGGQRVSSRSLDSTDLSAVARILYLVSDMDGDGEENHVGNFISCFFPPLAIGAAIGFFYVNQKRDRKNR